MRARSVKSLSVRRGKHHDLRISWRILFAAPRLIAGLKLTKYSPRRFRARRGRNVKLKNSKRSTG
jgi:hypothetical protein